jgi:large subunit ribosomal protein L33
VLFSIGYNGMRDIITLACGACKRRNYTTTKNKKNTPNKLELKKYCSFCRVHTLHKETK